MKKWLVVLMALMVACGTVQIASASVQDIPLSGATASFEQAGFGIAFAIDGSLDPNHGWAVDPQELTDQQAIFHTNVQVAAGSELTFTLSQLFLPNSNGKHLLREFQLSVIDAVTHNVTAVIPTSVSATSSLTVSGTHVLNASYPGSVPQSDTYVVTATTPFEQIEGFQLDVFAPDGTQPSNNNFVLSEFGVTGDVVPEPTTIVIWSLIGSAWVGLHVWQRRRGSVESVAGAVRHATWPEENRTAIRAIIERGRGRA